MQTGQWLCVIASLIAPFGLRAAEAEGRVFLDQNRNSVLDAGEPGVEGVRVSNGLDVTRSDADGRYRLTVDDQTLLFITKPSGYATPVNDHMLPQFYYIHQPSGSPAGLRYRGIEPTGPLPAQINFPLIERPEPKRFEAILLSDPQPQTVRELDYIRDDVVSELIGTEAAFGMTMGDILFDDLSMFPRYNALIAQIGVPWYNVPGNHELNLNAQSDRWSLETFKRFYGPPYYAFEYGDALFVVLDNIEYRGNGQADAGAVRPDGGYDAALDRRQLKWLERELSFVDSERLVFIATHAPLGREDGSYPTRNRERLFRLLAGRPNLYSVAGHTHTTEHVYFDEGNGFPGPGTFHHHILATVSGSWWSGPFDERGIAVSNQTDGTPNGYHRLEVDGTSLSVRFKGAGKPAGEQMRIVFDVAYASLEKNGQRDYLPGVLQDGQMSADALDAATIIVNLFDGGPRSEVAYQVGDGPFMPLKRVLRRDPYIIEQFDRHRETKKSWVEAMPSTHLFEADFGDDLSPGTHRVTVRAKDEFGQLHHAHTVVEIQAGSPQPEDRVHYPDR